MNMAVCFCRSINKCTHAQCSYWVPLHTILWPQVKDAIVHISSLFLVMQHYYVLFDTFKHIAHDL